MRGKRAKKREVKPDPVFNSTTVSKLTNYVMQDGKKQTAYNLVTGALESLNLKELQKHYEQTQKAKHEEEVSKAEKRNKARGKGNETPVEKEFKVKKLTHIDAFDIAIDNILPEFEIRSRRIGGANYQIPVPVEPSRQLSLALRWLVDSARQARKKDNFAVTLGQEITSAFKGEGSAVKKKEDTHKMADANKAFAQFG